MTNIFFVEGVSGVGKTTAVETLCRELGKSGIPAQCFIEGDPSNPVDLFGCAYLTPGEFAGILGQYPHDAGKLLGHSTRTDSYALVRYRDMSADYFHPPLLDFLREREGFYKPKNPMPLDAYTRVFVDCWKRYLASSEIFAIFDGPFLYHRINDLTRNYGADDDQIVAHLIALLTAMLPHSLR